MDTGSKMNWPNHVFATSERLKYDAASLRHPERRSSIGPIAFLGHQECMNCCFAPNVVAPLT